MPQEEDTSPAFEFALVRYKQGECPGCGKGVGNPEGWSIEANLEILFATLAEGPGR